MNQSASGQLSSTVRLIFVPALVSLIVTLWRLTGELLQWSARFYNPEAGGSGAIVGITWLAPVFGIYFALHLTRTGQKTLLAYGLAARLPVILIMALAIQGGWGTHYDARPGGFPEMGWHAAFLWLGFFPQLLFWVSFTIVIGAFFGTPAALIFQRRKAVAETAAS